jgi:hypothetical protein
MTTSASSSLVAAKSDGGGSSISADPTPVATFSLRRLWRAEFLSPKDLVKRAILITIVFGIAHLAGLKEFTTVLNGTMGSVQLGFGISAFLGLSYIFLYLAFVLVVPILLLAAAILSAWKRLR